MSSGTPWHRSGLFWILLTTTAALAGALVARMLTPAPIALESGTWLPAPRPVADFTLTDARGRDFGSDRLQGRPSLLFFGFTHCPDICPATLAQLAAVQREIPELQVVFVSLDPERDTPEVLGRYAGAFHPDLVAVTGPPAARAPLERSLSVASMRVPQPGGGYSVDHSAALYLLDAQGRWVAAFTPPFEAKRLAADLRHALRRLS